MIDTLVVVACRGDGLRIERSLVVNHPQVASYDGNIQVADIAEHLPRECVAYRGFLETDVCSGIGIFLRKRVGTADRTVPFVRIKPVAAIEEYSAVVTCKCRGLRYAIVVENRLGALVNDTPKSCTTKESEIKAGNIKIISPRHIRLRENAPELDIILCV